MPKILRKKRRVQHLDFHRGKDIPPGQKRRQHRAKTFGQQLGCIQLETRVCLMHGVVLILVTAVGQWRTERLAIHGITAGPRRVPIPMPKAREIIDQPILTYGNATWFNGTVQRFVTKSISNVPNTNTYLLLSNCFPDYSLHSEWKYFCHDITLFRNFLPENIPLYKRHCLQNNMSIKNRMRISGNNFGGRFELGWVFVVPQSYFFGLVQWNFVFIVMSCAFTNFDYFFQPLRGLLLFNDKLYDFYREVSMLLYSFKYSSMVSVEITRKFYPNRNKKTLNWKGFFSTHWNLMFVDFSNQIPSFVPLKRDLNLSADEVWELNVEKLRQNRKVSLKIISEEIEK